MPPRRMTSTKRRLARRRGGREAERCGRAEAGRRERGAQQAAAADVEGRVHRGVLGHAGAQRRWNSGAMQQQGERLRAVGGAFDLLRAWPRSGSGPEAGARRARARRAVGRAGRPRAWPIRCASTPPPGPAIPRRGRASRRARVLRAGAGRACRCRRRARSAAGRRSAMRAPSDSTRALETTNSSGRLQLRRCVGPGLGARQQFAVDLGQLTAAAR